MAPLHVVSLIFASSTFLSLNHASRRLLQSSNPSAQPTSNPLPDGPDCCEKTTGLLYKTIDCSDDNTPIILEQTQNYLIAAENGCTDRTKCSYSNDSLDIPSTAETEKCLIAWALLQQFYNECPQLIQSPSSSTTTENDSGDEDVDQIINSVIYDIFNDDEHCSECYHEYSECDGVTICNMPSNDNNCGVCSVVTCFGDINNANDVQNILEGSNSIDMWWRSLLILTAFSMLLVCVWGTCHMSKVTIMRQALGGGHPLRRDMMPVSNVENDSDLSD